MHFNGIDRVATCIDRAKNDPVSENGAESSCYRVSRFVVLGFCVHNNTDWLIRITKQNCRMCDNRRPSSLLKGVNQFARYLASIMIVLTILDVNHCAWECVMRDRLMKSFLELKALLFWNDLPVAFF